VVQDQYTPWPEHDGPALAGVSSFGFGGTNAHVVVEGPPHRAPRDSRPETTAHLLPLSARSPEALRALAGAYRGLLSAGEPPLADICYTAATGRAQQAHRLCVLGRTAAEIEEGLRRWLAGQWAPNVWSGRRFPGRVAGQPADGPGAPLNGAEHHPGADPWPSLGRQFASGADVRWEEVYSGREAERVPLPTYPFQRVICWFGPRPGGPCHAGEAGAPEHPLLGRRLRSPALRDVVFETRWSQDRPPWAGAPGAAPTAVPEEVFRRMAAAVAEMALGPGSWEMEGAVLEGPCLLPAAGGLTVQAVLSPANEVRVFSLSQASEPLPPHWALHFRCTVARPKKSMPSAGRGGLVEPARLPKEV
jgi:acyl transferase domain-containing protein